MHFIYSNFAVILVAVVVTLLAWLFGGARGDVLEAVAPWLILFTVETLVAFPQRDAQESMSDARGRVWDAMKRDPFVWVSAGLLVLLAIPFANKGLCVSCDRVLIAQGFDPAPPIPFLPHCVNRVEHLNVFLWFAVALPVAVAVRHCLSHRGKRLLVEMIVWNGFALAVLGFVQSVAEAPGPLWQPFGDTADAVPFFSTFGYENMAGDYFAVLFGLSVALWRRTDDEVYEERMADRSGIQQNRYHLLCRRHYFLIPAVVFFFAAINTLSRAAIMLVISMTAVYFVHTFFSLARRMKRADRVRKGTIALAVTGAVVFFAVQTVPPDVQREVDSLDSDSVLTRVTSKGGYHARVATEIWKDNFLFGCGGWGYKHFCVPKLTPKDKESFQRVGGANVHNDYLQFLAEHGFVGFGLIVTTVLILIAPVAAAWKRLYRKTRFAKAADLPAKPVALFVMSAPVFCILMAVLATVVHGFGDCPFRSAAILSLFYASLAALPGFLPKDATQEEEKHHHASR